MKLKQELPSMIAPLEVIAEEESIATEPVFRRVNADFVSEQGGVYAKRLLGVAESLGMVTDTTRIMVQKTPFRDGFHPDIPQWHVDCMPGIPSTLRTAVQQRIDGLICVIFEQEQHRHDLATLFLQGELTLDMTEDADSDYKPGSHLSMDGGDINWIHPQVERQLETGEVTASPIMPNIIYRYSSADMHKAPTLFSNQGYRLVIRLNTPPADFGTDVPVNNTVIKPEPRYVFSVDKDQRTWKRVTVEGA